MDMSDLCARPAIPLRRRRLPYLAELAIDNEPLFEPLASVHNGARCDGAHRRIVVRSRQPLQPVEGAGMVVRQLAQVRVFDEP